MPNQSPEPSSERSFYEFLRKLLYQNQNSADSAGLIAYVATLGFFALIFVSFMALTVMRTTNTPPTGNTTTITNTQGGLPQTK